MNENALTIHRAPPPAMQPQGMGEAIEFAKLMAQSKLVPEHLQNKPADCLLVIEQAARWQTSPYAVAQCTSSIKGKLMFEGKLVSAVIHASGYIRERMRYDFTGTGDALVCTATATLHGEASPRAIKATLAEARTTNEMWKKQPEQQLTYFAVRKWARRHLPEVMLGIYVPEEFDPEPPPPRPTRAAVSQQISAEPTAIASAARNDDPAGSATGLAIPLAKPLTKDVCENWEAAMIEQLENAPDEGSAMQLMADNLEALDFLRARGGVVAEHAARITEKYDAVLAQMRKPPATAGDPGSYGDTAEPTPAADESAPVPKASPLLDKLLADIKAAATDAEIDGYLDTYATNIEVMSADDRKRVDNVVALRRREIVKGKR